ncbi:hypothetical protein [Pseudomonas sp. NPDC007930]|uniref:hypothetical protein n=1 Tax=Pseudomonas sp. NPDC007930 TaxID=3364417 RepID=UPI0036E12C9F
MTPRPPCYAPRAAPAVPRWKRWAQVGLLVLLAWAGCLALLWPAAPPRRGWWLLALLGPLLLVLGLSLRLWLFQLARLRHARYQQVLAATRARWWHWRSLGLPLEQVLLLGPAGEGQQAYQGCMAATAVPSPVAAGGAPALRCPLGTVSGEGRAAWLGARLARRVLALPGLEARWPRLRALAWGGCPASHAAFAAVLQAAGLRLPAMQLPLQAPADLCTLIDLLHYRYDAPQAWLLCAGVVSVAPAGAAPGMAGEAAFAWVASRAGQHQVHRAEVLAAAPGDSAASLCAQVQRYLRPAALPAAALALGSPAAQALRAAGWPLGNHELGRYWGELQHCAPFVALSLAWLQAAQTEAPCGWASHGMDQHIVIGMAGPYGNANTEN